MHRDVRPDRLFVALGMALVLSLPAAAWAQDPGPDPAPRDPAQATPTRPAQEPAFSAAPPLAEGFSITPFVSAGFGGQLENTPAGFGTAFGYGANERVSLEAELGLAPAGIQGAFTRVDTSVWNFNGNLLYHFYNPGFTPYVTVGLGIVSSNPDFLGAGLDEPDTSSTGFAVNWGGGFKTALNDRIGLRGDIRYFNARNAAPDHWRVYAGVMLRRLGSN